MVLCHRTAARNSEDSNGKDFIGERRIVSEISIVLFEHPQLSSIRRTAFPCPCIASCFELIRSKRSGEMKKRKRNAPPLLVHPSSEPVPIGIERIF